DIGLEVEGINEYETIKGGLKGLVVGKVLTCEKHPDADKLSKTTVDVGLGEALHIVCGAPNVQAGQTVVVATIGATIYSGTDSFTIKKSKIRGETSEGMICAEDEIGVGQSHDGIMVLPNHVKAGTRASEYFMVENDTVFEIGLTPNRADAASHYGVARDLAARLSIQTPISAKLPDIKEPNSEHNDLTVKVSIEDTNACYRYCGVAIAGVAIDESPGWLKNRLRSICLNPINNVVDITNFVLHELGQPLHAFDADKLAGRQVIVKPQPAGAKLKPGWPGAHPGCHRLNDLRCRKTCCHGRHIWRRTFRSDRAHGQHIFGERLLQPCQRS
ncbi:MAG: phenylalanine--tRNA ligase subunit beta, partial [Bacteroidales bacterium]|nr:phenylalanine--tRNA ligase subunit beta [Bacteroidales bacterium]